jgi:glyoxylase-like metal-dependent hydrolase (beta-lactamase superfamily II)
MMTIVTKIRLKLSNATLIQGERAILVDSGSPGESQEILKALAQAGVAASDLSLLLHTHGHSDHAGSTAELRRLSGAPAAIHAADAAMLRRGRNGPLPPTRLETRLVKPFVDKPFPSVEPDVVFDNEMDLAPYGVDGRVVMTPGHTAGSVSVLLAGGEAIVGDVLMGGLMGGTFQAGKPNLHYFVQDAGQLRQSLGYLVAQPLHTLTVGHGGPLAMDAVRRRSERLLAQLEGLSSSEDKR